MGVEANKTQDGMLVVGKLGASYGIRGWIKVFSYTEMPESLFDYQPWMLKIKGEWVEYKLEDWKRHNQGYVCKLADIEDRDEAQAYTNFEIAVNADELPELGSDEGYYWKDLYGMSVVTTKGYDLGVVDDIMETGSNDVLVIKANLKDAFGKKERLVPFLSEQVIKHVDLAAQRIEVDWDPGF